MIKLESAIHQTTVRRIFWNDVYNQTKDIVWVKTKEHMKYIHFADRLWNHLCESAYEEIRRLNRSNKNGLL